MYMFSGGEREFFHGQIIYGKGSFLGVKFSGEITNWVIFPEFPYKIIFKCFALSFPSQFYAWSC